MEKVLGVERNLIKSLLTSEFGYIPDTKYEFIERNLQPRDREHAETDETFKQIIPYLYIECGQNFLLYKRTKKQSEERLHEKLSLGIGGHINPIDCTSDSVINNCLLRELTEEVTVHDLDPASTEFLGFINDDLSEVGKVHLGLVFKAKAFSEKITVNETDKLNCEWVNFTYFYLLGSNINGVAFNLCSN
jgi:predicted NUDIX family phosphoesterase